MSSPSSSFSSSFDDIQALLGTGFTSLRQGRYHLGRVSDPTLARRWIGEVLHSGTIKTLAQVRRPDGAAASAGAGSTAARSMEAVTLGFSAAGLRALGLEDDPRQPFPSIFHAGMAHPDRRLQVGDEPDEQGELERWDWGDGHGHRATGAGSASGTAGIHVLVCHFWADGTEPTLRVGAGNGPEDGIEWLHTIDTFPGAISTASDGGVTEPFGFKDGIGQPHLRGMARSRRHGMAADAATSAFDDDRLVWPGEFVLGHRNEYGETSYAPNVRGWPQDGQGTTFAANGSYLVARQIEQYVDVFHDTVAGSGVEHLAAKMVGRREDGWPLVTGPLPPARADDFRYLAGDERGFECPRGAHVRRANPRDALGHEVTAGIRSARLHQLLRRGRVYQRTGSGPRSGTGDGLMFVALNADLDRQFEFIHRNWIMGSRFGDLADEQDPLLGTRPGRMFSMPGCPSGQRVGPLPRFTRVRGGGYFFMPGMSALRFLAGGS